MTGAWLGPPSLSAELARRGRPRDVGLLVAVPAVLVAAWLAGEPGQAGLAFHPDAPTATAAFAAHYAHASAGHLAGNLAVYAGAVGLGYPLAVLGGCRRRFVAMVVGVLLAVPIALSGVHLVGSGSAGIVGFSGLALALVGLLPPVLFEYLRSRVNAAVTVTDAMGVFLLGSSAIVWPAAGAIPAAEPLAVAIGAVGLAALAPLAWRVWRRRRDDRPRRPGSAGALPVGAVLGFLLAAALATSGSAADGAGTTATLHLVGYGLGFVGASGTAHYHRLRGPPAPPGVAD